MRSRGQSAGAAAGVTRPPSRRCRTAAPERTRLLGLLALSVQALLPLARAYF